jgi:hypothetical protein
MSAQRHRTRPQIDGERADDEAPRRRS